MSDLIKNRTSRNQASYHFKNRLIRFTWGIVYFFFVRFSPVYFRKWRLFWYMLFGAKFEGRVNIYPKALVWAPWNLTMHNGSCIANGVNVYSQSSIVIGERSLVSQGAHLCSGSHDFESHMFDLVSKPIIIKNDVWICAEAFVGPGVTLEDGVVLGARAVAYKDLAAWTVYAGNPAIKLRDRLKTELWK